MITLNQSMGKGTMLKLCYRDTDRFIIYVKTEDFFEDISNDVEKRFDTSNYDKNDKRPLPIGKNKEVPGLFKDELGGNRSCYIKAKNIGIFKILCFKISMIVGLVIKMFIDHGKDLKAMIMMFIQKKLIRLH